MSAESAIDNLISTLKWLSSSYRSEATALAKSADDRLLALRTPPADALTYNAVQGETTFARTIKPPELSEIKPPEFPDMGEIQEVDGVSAIFNSAFILKEPTDSDDLTAPEFYAEPPPLPFQEIFPDEPLLTAPELPSQTFPTKVIVEPLDGTPPTVPEPEFTEFTGDFLAEYDNGLSLMGNDLSQWTAWLNSLRDKLLPVEALLIDRLRGVLTGKEPGLPDAWEKKSFQQGQQTAYYERYAALAELDAQPSSVTGLPSGLRVDSRLAIELQTLKAVMEAAAKTTNERQQREVQHLQWALELCLKMADAAIQLKAQETTWRMRGVMIALDGAEAALDVALRVLAFKEKELAFIIRYNETQVRRTEDLMKIEKSKLDVLQTEVANNQLKTTFNDHQAEIYRTAAQWVETTIQLYQMQIEYLTVEINWRKVELQLFELEVAAHQTKLKGAESDQAAQLATIKGDLAQVEAEMGKVRKYDAELSMIEAETKAQMGNVKIQIRNNANKLDEYNAIVSAQLQYLREMDSAASIALNALMKGFSSEVAEQKIALANQELIDQNTLIEATNKMQIEQLELSKILKTHQVRLAQLTAQASVIDSGASTLGSIAQSTFSGLNAVASTDIVESA